MEDPHVLPRVEFGEAFKKGFTHFTDFGSRSRRSEYWFLALAVYLIEFVVGIITAIIVNLLFEEDEEEIAYGINGIFGLIGFIFMLPCAVRRLHDIGKSGWFMFLVCLPIVGHIILLVFFCTDSQMETNEYGPSPKYSNFPSEGDTMV